MPDQVFTVPWYFDYGATFLWAVSGAVVGARRGYDLSGVAALALVSSTGVWLTAVRRVSAFNRGGRMTQLRIRTAVTKSQVESGFRTSRCEHSGGSTAIRSGLRGIPTARYLRQKELMYKRLRQCSDDCITLSQVDKP